MTSQTATVADEHAAAADAMSAVLLALEEQFQPPALALLLGENGAGVPGRLWERALLGPARAFLSRPGKRFRAALVTTGWRLGGATGSPPVLLPLLVELVHAGALVIDDIEDDSPSRRGAPALHKLVGVPLALNTGNWLYFWPLALIPRLALPPLGELALSRAFHTAMARSHHGQALDLEARVPQLRQTEVAAVVAATTQLKTGSLTALAGLAGAIAAGADEARAAAIARFGSALGAGLQMLDDVGNLLGRTDPDKRYEDLLHGRPTWPWAWLAETADHFTFTQLQARAKAVVDRTLEPQALGQELLALVAAAGRQRARGTLGDALACLRDEVGDGPVLNALEAEIARLEASYG